MKKKVALLVVYNHRYDKNIPIINYLYKGRFSYVYHLVPFYDGNEENVIAVYDNSFYFHNYIAQAYQHIKNLDFTHFFIVADDMIVNPKLNELNIWRLLGITETDCYISRFSILQQQKDFWPWIAQALKYKRIQPGVEISNILPPIEEAKKRFSLHNIPTDKIPIRRLYTKYFRLFYQKVLKELPFSLTLDYPLVGGYSDIFLVTNKEISQFCQILGAFAATRLFVEMAIPTALILTADNIKTDEDVLLKRGDLWLDEIDKFATLFNYNLSNLIDRYPHEKLFIHPVKLSKWEVNNYSNSTIRTFHHET